MRKNAILLTVAMLIASVGLQAQEQKKLIASFNSVDDIQLVTENATTSEFIIKTDKDQVNRMLESAKTFGSYLSLSSEEIEGDEGSYKMNLKFNHNAQLTEIHKILTFLGISGVSIDKKEYPLDHLLTVKK